jgi:hypothetical protein
LDQYLSHEVARLTIARKSSSRRLATSFYITNRGPLALFEMLAAVAWGDCRGGSGPGLRILLASGENEAKGEESGEQTH